MIDLTQAVEKNTEATRDLIEYLQYVFGKPK